MLHIQRQLPKYSCEGRETKDVVHLVETCTCLWVWGHGISRPLVGGVTLLSSQALGEDPGLGAGDTQLLIKNLWHC